ncbi:alpha/beta hydrolase family protein [Murinocardiopsis flavida]|uniref:Alpha/beta hydrolase family protein n=1 Tax=Murinocardiopsis flavida TaxID=645275 RepID=A0A2P8D136_9ACTN|nr:alpha/beta hydrolase family protein [Murinocardiopsis flavida]
MLCALALLAAAGCTADAAGGAAEPTPGLARFYDQQVDWRDCGSGFQCAGVTVPRDYDRPRGATLTIAAKRLPAAGDPLGSLVVNPGGPGGSGVDYVAGAAGIVSEDVRRHFDIVGFDPRGVARSSPVYCLDAAGLDAYQGARFDTRDGDGDQSELTAKGVRQMQREVKTFVAACEENSGAMLGHVGTADVARDLDVLRAALGDDALTYLGKSYGTAIGAHYADRFPGRVRALVLDGAIDPAADQLELSVQQAEGFGTALDAFVADCVRRTDCPLGGADDGAGSAMRRLHGLLADTGRTPLDSTLGDGREVTRSRVETGLLGALYSEDLWPQARTALADAFDGDGTGLLRLGDRVYGRGESDRTYRNSAAALVAVNCADSASPRTVSAYREAAEELRTTSPVFGPGLAWNAMACAYWPEDAVAAPASLTAKGADPILVVGTTRDSATPYRWSRRLADRLDSGVLLTRDGDGHTGYRMGDSCVDTAVDRYLIKAEAPDEGTVCR